MGRNSAMMLNSRIDPMIGRIFGRFMIASLFWIDLLVRSKKFPVYYDI